MSSHCSSAHNKKYYKKNKVLICKKQLLQDNKNRHKIRMRQNAKWELNKIAVINVLTDGEGTCRWCKQGDIDVLCIDHIADDGIKHKNKDGRSGVNLYKWIIRNTYPSGFQVLCANCNLKKEILKRRQNRITSDVGSLTLN